MTRAFTYYFPELEIKYVPMISNVDELKPIKKYKIGLKHNSSSLAN